MSTETRYLGVVTFCWTSLSVWLSGRLSCVQPTSPSLMRLSMMLIPYSVLMRSSRYHVMYSSSIVGEPVDRDAREVALVEELLLETAEEPLRGRVVRAAALRAHRADQPVALADAYPFRPPVVAAAVRVDDRRLADLTPVRGVAPRAPGHGHELVPGHQAHDPFGGHDDAHAPQFQVDAPVPVRRLLFSNTSRQVGLSPGKRPIT